ncbi:hypothetical protein C8J56DRAFT_1029082 [Mycena floridula]|nr:hypothetical protein C8J56DRAFT_1029082 [Mycena floridula]
MALVTNARLIFKEIPEDQPYSRVNSFWLADCTTGDSRSFEQYSVVSNPESQRIRIIKNEANLPWSLYVGVLGMAGKTAYYGWKEYGNYKKSRQPTNKLDGLKVIASASSDEKVDFMKFLGIDVAFNYKTTDTAAVLAKEGPLDIYWDHVGSEVLDAALLNAVNHTRFIITGQIAGYNSGNNVSFKVNRAGTCFDCFETSSSAQNIGLTIYKQCSEHITQGLENAGKAILDQQKGLNNGKSVMIVAEN